MRGQQRGRRALEEKGRETRTQERVGGAEEVAVDIKGEKNEWHICFQTLEVIKNRMVLIHESCTVLLCTDSLGTESG